MLRIVLLSALLLVAGVALVPEAAAIQELEGVCRNLGPCTPTTFGCWIDNFVPPSVQCRL